MVSVQMSSYHTDRLGRENMCDGDRRPKMVQDNAVGRGMELAEKIREAFKVFCSSH